MQLTDEMLGAARDKLVTIRDHSTLIQAAELLSDGTDLIAVCNPANTLVGVISKTDVVAQVRLCQGSACTIVASSVMSPEVVVCRATDRVEDISNFIRDRGLKNIPVVDDRGRPIGLLTARDILRALLLDAQYDAAQLIDYVKGVGYR